VLALFLVANSVGLDNFGVAAGIGTSGVDRRLRARIALVFGAFEAGMPLLGLLLGRTAADALGSHAQLVAGLVLCLVGLYGVAHELIGRSEARPANPPGLSRLVVLGATLSFDNLAVGFALGSYHVNVVVAALVIATFSVALTLLGLELGARLGERMGQRGELVGGALLIGVGVLVGTGVL
jgi:manganese efflux pump family protein